MGNILTKCCTLDNFDDHRKNKSLTPSPTTFQPNTLPRTSPSPTREVRPSSTPSSSRSQDLEVPASLAAGIGNYRPSSPLRHSSASSSDQRVNNTTNLSSQSTPQSRTKNNANDNNKSLPITFLRQFSASLQNLTHHNRREQSRQSSSEKSHHSTSTSTHTVPPPQSLSLAQGLVQSPYTLSDEEIKVILANEIPPSEIENLAMRVDAGGMGIIHVAEWKGTKIAIKEASSHVISKEVEIYNRMRGYEGVVQFYGVTRPFGFKELCIVTKFAENGSLSLHLKAAFHKLTWADKLNLATQITSSIKRLHEEGIYHRDLHGGNILIDKAGNALLTDFGASTVMEERVVRSMDEFAIATRTTPEGKSKFVSKRIPSLADHCDAGTSMPSSTATASLSSPPLSPPPMSDTIGEASGTTAAALSSGFKDKHTSRSLENDEKHDPLIGVMAYIAPERFRNPRYFDARCDIYSLGVLLWELTSGHSAFAKVPQDVQLAVAILNGRREEPIEGTPEAYRALYEKCWESDPEMRPSLDEILSTLSEVRGSLTKEQLAVTRERNVIRNEDGTDFEESLSIPRPTSDYQKYLMPE